jgi:phosphoglycerate dehydrogenase-like enzyme
MSREIQDRPLPNMVALEPFRREFLIACRSLGRVTYRPEALTHAQVPSATLKKCDILLTRNRTMVSPALLKAAPRLRCIVVYGAGKEHLDLAAIQNAGIHLIRCSDATAQSVAEFTLGLALSMTRRIPQAIACVKAGGWEHRALEGMEISGRNVCVIGCGPIGARTASLFCAFGARVAVVRRSSGLPPQLSALGCSQMPLYEALALCDIVTIHVSAGSDAPFYFGKEALQSMRKGAFLINTSRGSVLDLAALLAALRCGHIAGAALDVLPEEPPPSPIDCPNLIITPHLALYSREAVARRIESIISSLRDWLRTGHAAC